MANTVIGLQMSFDSGNKTPVVAGSNSGVMRLSFYNIGRFILGMLIGTKYKQGSSYLQYQTSLVAASATATPAAVQSGDTLTIAGTALTAAQRRATATVTCATAIAGNTITVNGVLFTGTAGAVTPGEATFSIDTGDTATATSIAAQVNAYASPKLSGVLAARSSAAVVTFYAIAQGTAGNALTLATSDNGTLAKSGATFANGAALANNTFDFAGTNATTGAAIAAAIAASTTAAIQTVTASADATTGVVTVTNKVAGVAGNATTFVSSNGTRLAVTGSGFLAGGSASDPVRLTL
ncbi:MAG: hypothetical protein IPJ65_42770 [Archangiaceae bacterium]|nr:hypothetical protein [Archangiaceae bacterium]